MLALGLVAPGADATRPLSRCMRDTATTIATMATNDSPAATNFAALPLIAVTRALCLPIARPPAAGDS